MPFGLGAGELIAFLLVILLLFGAKRIPEIAGSFGKGIKEFKRNMSEAQQAITSETTRPADAPRYDQAPADRLRAETRPADDDTTAREPKRLL